MARTKQKECPYCNQEQSAFNRFCNSCGYRFSDKSIPPKDEPAPAPSEPKPEKPETPAAPPEEKREPASPFKDWFDECELD